jgi:phospholipid-transporting ATPase
MPAHYPSHVLLWLKVYLDPKIHFDDPRLLEALRAGGPQAELIHEFLVVLAVCHTVIPEIVRLYCRFATLLCRALNDDLSCLMGPQDDKTGEKVYRASSPDEEALVKAARVLGYDFTTPAPVVSLTIATGPSPCRAQYEILNVNEFNSTRKRQSVVVKTPDGALVLYCKGADNIMFERCGSAEKDKSLLLEHLKCFASEGLRTLVLARRELSSQEYNDWNRCDVPFFVVIPVTC